MSRRRKPFVPNEAVEFQHDVGSPWQRGEIIGRSHIGRSYYEVKGPPYDVVIDGKKIGSRTVHYVPAQRIRRPGERWGSR